MLEILGSFDVNCSVRARSQSEVYKGCIFEWEFFDAGSNKRSINTSHFTQNGKLYQQWGSTVYNSANASSLYESSVSTVISPNFFRLFGVMAYGWLYPPSGEQTDLPFIQNTPRVAIPFDTELTATYNMTIELRKETDVVIGEPDMVTYSTYLIGLVGSLPEWARVLTFNLESGGGNTAWKNFYDSMCILGYGIGWALVNGLGVPRQTPTPTLPKDIFIHYAPLQLPIA